MQVRHTESEGVAMTTKKNVRLLRSPANAERLLRSIKSADARRLTEHELIKARPDAK